MPSHGNHVGWKLFSDQIWGGTSKYKTCNSLLPVGGTLTITEYRHVGLDVFRPKLLYNNCIILNWTQLSLCSYEAKADAVSYVKPNVLWGFLTLNTVAFVCLLISIDHFLPLFLVHFFLCWFFLFLFFCFRAVCVLHLPSLGCRVLFWLVRPNVRVVDGIRHR